MQGRCEGTALALAATPMSVSQRVLLMVDLSVRRVQADPAHSLFPFLEITELRIMPNTY
jgi:hypothetical protein